MSKIINFRKYNRMGAAVIAPTSTPKASEEDLYNMFFLIVINHRKANYSGDIMFNKSFGKALEADLITKYWDNEKDKAIIREINNRIDEYLVLREYSKDEFPDNHKYGNGSIMLIHILDLAKQYDINKDLLSELTPITGLSNYYSKEVQKGFKL